MKIRQLFFIIFCCVFSIVPLFSLENQPKSSEDSARARRNLLEMSKVESSKKDINLTMRNVDITLYPIIKVIVEAFNKSGQPLDTLYADNLTVLENGQERKVISVEKISSQDRVPMDFVFAIDITGSMQSFIDAVKSKIYTFSSFLKEKGIDHTFSLILFNDVVERVYQPTSEVTNFYNWISPVRAFAGGDIKENALEALYAAATKIQYRPSANKIVILVTDAPYHQKGETGQGSTNQTTQSIIKLLQKEEVRVVGIVPTKLKDYEYIAEKTRGYTYDMDYPFSVIVNNISSQLTNLYALKYRSTQPAIPDSIEIGVINEQKQILTQKTIPIVELGRKLIIENMLYKTGHAQLPDSVPELEVLTEFMKNKPNVAILVEGHTDDIGSHLINDKLSLERAETVKTYLIAKGISDKRIKTKGYGKRKPIASNKTEFGRKMNRRTEIIIIAK